MGSARRRQRRARGKGGSVSTVNTALGPVDGADLGQTLMHEHVFVLSPEIEKTAQEWDEDHAQATAVRRLEELKASGWTRSSI